MDFSEINRSTLSEVELALLNEIEDTFYQVREIEEEIGLTHELSKCYMVFTFNLFLLKAFAEGLDMMENIDPTYYSEQLSLDVEVAFQYLQETEDLKNQVQPDKVTRRAYCQEQAEILDVAFGLMLTLQHIDFPGRDHFQVFIDQMKDKSYTVRKVPQISMVTDE